MPRSSNTTSAIVGSEKSAAALGPLMLDLEGPAINTDEIALIQNPLVGGIIFFARNYVDRSQLQDLVGTIRRHRPDILLAVDQEGGRVQRFINGYTRLPPMQAFVRDYRRDAVATLALVTDVGWLLASEVLASGVDFSFAPVLDVDERYSVISNRAFSSSPSEVVDLAGAFVDGMHEAGMATTGKHFPGHGSVIEDSHDTLPRDQRCWDDIVAKDYQPFYLLRQKLDALMPAHIVFSQIDAQPVGFSRYWLQTVVREQMRYNGVIFSDDLTMAATATYGDYPRRAALALDAGCDMVLVCNNRRGAQAVLESLQHDKRPLSMRLAQMRRRQQPSWDALEQSSRRQATIDKLQRYID